MTRANRVFSNTLLNPEYASAARCAPLHKVVRAFAMRVA